MRFCPPPRTLKASHKNTHSCQTDQLRLYSPSANTLTQPFVLQRRRAKPSNCFHRGRKVYSLLRQNPAYQSLITALIICLISISPAVPSRHLSLFSSLQTHFSFVLEKRLQRDAYRLIALHTPRAPRLSGGLAARLPIASSPSYSSKLRMPNTES